MIKKPYILYGMMASLYTAKVRAYMRYHGINFIERAAGLPEFANDIIPITNRWIVPVLKTPEEAILQDGTIILDYLNENEPHKGSMHAESPLMQAIAHLLELFGSEGLLRPAMHYRWNFDKENLDFLKVSFQDVLPPALSAEEQESFFLHASGRMRKAAKNFGVLDDLHTDVEASYHEFLDIIEAHLSKHPFLLGGRPTIADYALFGPLFAHLGRDPKPLSLMQQKAPNLFQWVERMNAPAGNENHLYLKSGSDVFSDEDIPQTLVALLKYVADEYLCEITSHVTFANDWIAKHPGIEPGTNGQKGPTKRGIGFAEFKWRDQKNSSIVMLYRFFILQRLTDHFAALDPVQQTTIRKFFADTGLEPILDLRTSRRVTRKDFLEVWE